MIDDSESDAGYAPSLKPEELSAWERKARAARELEQAERVREACAQVVAHHLFDEGFDLSELLPEVKP